MRPIGVGRYGRLCNSKPIALNRDEDSSRRSAQIKAHCPSIGMMNPQSAGYKGNSPSLGIARDYPKAGTKALRWP